MPIAAILAGLVGAAPIVGPLLSAGSIITAGLLQKNSMENTNAANLRMSEQLRQDELAQKQKEMAMAERQNALQYSLERRKLAAELKQVEYTNRKETEATNYNRLQNAADRFSQYVTNKNALLNSRLSPLIKG
jgi:glutaminase